MIGEGNVSLCESIFCSCVEKSNKADYFRNENVFYYRPIRVGKSILLYGRKRSYFPYQCMVGGDWPMVVFVYFLIISINGVILGVISPLGWPPVLIGIIGAIVLLIVYSSVALSDPGIVFRSDYTEVIFSNSSSTSNDVEANSEHSDTVPLNSGGVALTAIGSNDIEESKSNQEVKTSSPMSNLPKVPSNKIECGRCELKRPYSAHHCDHCGSCCHDLDHHCPWCGKCIGERNMPAFRVLLGIFCFQFYYLLGTLIYYFIFHFVYKLPHGPSF